MDTGGGHGEGMKPMREIPTGLEAKELKTADEVMKAVQEIGGRNLLSEPHEERGSEAGAWIKRVETETLSEGGRVIGIQENGSFVGLVLVTPEGFIEQFLSTEDNEAAVLEKSLPLLEDKGFDSVKVRISPHNDDMLSLFEHAGFIQRGESEDGKIVLEKE